MFFFQKKQNKIIRQNPQFLTKKRGGDRPIKFGRVVFYLLSFFFLGTAAYIFIFSPFTKVENYALSGINELQYEKVLEKIKNSCGGNFLGFIPRDNFFLVSKKKISRDLTEEFKKIKTVEVEKKFPQTVAVNVTERKSLIVWCSAGPCYILDGQGYAYTGADIDSPEAVQNNLIRITDAGAQPVVLGEKILSEEYIRYLIGLREEIEKNSTVKITSEWATPSAVAEEAEIFTQEGWKIFFSAEIPPAKAVRTLKTFLEAEMDPEKRSQLDYADLRVENKVYYKLRSEETGNPNNNKEANVGK